MFSGVDRDKTGWIGFFGSSGGTSGFGLQIGTVPTRSGRLASMCLMRTKVVASSPICKSSVVDLVMSRDHQNDNAVWLCRFTKKKSEAKKGTEQSAFEPATTRSKVSGLPPRLSRNWRMHVKETSIESCRWPPRGARFSVRKRCVVCFWLNLTKSKFCLFRL